MKNIFKKLFKRRSSNEPWLAYYSKEEKKIKFTDKTIYEYLKESVGEDQDYIALNYFNTKISYKELFAKIEIASKALCALGVKEKDIVTICMPNTPEAIILFYAINNIGAIADMIHPLSSKVQIKNYLLETKSKILLLIDLNYEKMKDLIPKTSVEKVILASAKESMPPFMMMGYLLTKGIKIKKPRISNNVYLSWHDFLVHGHLYPKLQEKVRKSKDTALILHSGGTTGTPKGIMISNYSFNALAQQGGVNVYDVRPKDKIVTVLPIFHGFGLGVCVHCPLCLKVETILVPTFDSKGFYRILKNNKPQILAGVPTLWSAILDNKMFDKLNLSSLKYVISGGDYLTIPMEMRMNNFLRTHKANISISKGYGMTESVAATAYTFDGTNEPGSIGIPMIGNKFCICTPDTVEELKFGEEGEICVCGPTVMQGYYNNDEETKKVLRKHKDGNTWLHTGDLGYISESGIIYFTQRLKRIIVSSGFNIYPSNIENTIESHPLVDKCCVVGVAHPYKVQVAKSFIVLKDFVESKEKNKVLKEIKELCKNNLEVYSVPKYFEFREELPMTLYNKIDYLTLEKEEKNKINSSK